MRHVGFDLLQVTEAAAIAAAKWIGRGNKHAADQAAVDAMRSSLERLPIRGHIVIGEGERDEAPMLYIGEKVGVGWRGEGGIRMDIAVDPLEGTNLCAYDAPGAIAVLAATTQGKLLHAPDTYMRKLAVGAAAAPHIDLHKGVDFNLHVIAEATHRRVDELVVAVLERDRHHGLIEEIRTAGARVRLFHDGDVAMAVATVTPDSGVDALMGIGGAPEGVLAAAALRCLGGGFQGQLQYRNQEERERAERMGMRNHDAVYREWELVQGDVIFVATGVTSGPLLSGVKRSLSSGTVTTSSMVLDSSEKIIRRVETQKI